MQQTANIEIEWSIFKEAQEKYNPTPVTTIKKLNNSFECVCGGQKAIDGQCGLPVCTSCGIVESYFVDDSAEWINGPSDDGSVIDKSRCGAPKDLQLFSEHWGGSTIMKSVGRQTYAQKRMARIAFHQSMNHRDRALFHAYKSLDVASEYSLGLSDKTMRRAKIMYRKFNSLKLTRGAVRTGIKANCILYACKLDNIPRTTKEIAISFGIPTKDISRTSDLFREIMVGDVDQDTEDPVKALARPDDIVGRFLNNFKLENRRKVQAKCIKFSNKLDECVELMGKTPSSIAAVVVYKIIGDQTTKQEVSQKCNISMPTLNKIENIINKYLEVLVI